MPRIDPAFWSDYLERTLACYEEPLLRQVAGRLIKPRSQWPAEELIERCTAAAGNAAVIDRRLQDLDQAERRALALIGHLFGPQPGLPAAQSVPDRPLLMMKAYGVAPTAPANGWVWLRELLEYKWRYYRLHDGLTDFLSAAWQDVGTSSKDMPLFRLPRGLRWLYPVLWPIGFLWRNIRLFAGNNRQ